MNRALDPSPGGRFVFRSTLIIGASAVVVVIVLAAAVGLFSPKTTTSGEYTSAEVKEIVDLLRTDPACRDTRVTPFAYGYISLDLLDAVLGQPVSKAGRYPHLVWVYRTADGSATITPHAIFEKPNDGTPYLDLQGPVQIVGLNSNKPVQREALKTVILRIKKRFDAGDGAALAEKLEADHRKERDAEDEQFRKRDAEERETRRKEQARFDAELTAEAAERQRQRAADDAEIAERGEFLKDQNKATTDYADLRDSLPIGPERNALSDESDEWIKRRTKQLTDARKSGHNRKTVLLPTTESVLEAIRRKKTVPVGLSVEVGKAPPPAVTPFDVVQAKAHQEAWAKHLGVTIERTNGIGMKFVLIPPGEFLMGTPDSDPDATPATKPQHRVRISRAFYAGMHEVTLAAFRQFTDEAKHQADAEKEGNGGSGYDLEKAEFARKPEYTWKGCGVPRGNDHPVNNVSWNDATAFCEWLTRKTGQPCRLMTEAEWEYACRAGTTTRFHSGDDPETLSQVGNVADATGKAKFPEWTTIAATDGFVFTAPVGSFRANAFGLFDMHGNVTEWCQDWHHADEYAARASRVAVDPVRTEPPSQRILRGGDFIFHPKVCGSASRPYGPPNFRDFRTGFRVAVTLKPPEE